MLDYLGIAKRLDEAAVRYIVVGGVAVNMHGIPRMTYDLDLLVDMEDENLRRLLAILDGWGFRPKIPVDAMDLADAGKRKEWIDGKGMKAFSLVNEKWALSEIDIIVDAPVDYERACAGAVRIVVAGVEIPVISIDDLIRMKEVTGRAQDEADIRYLRQVQDEGR